MATSASTPCDTSVRTFSLGRGKKGHGRSSRRRRSPGSNNAHSGSENERKEYENRGATRRSRSRDNSPEKKQEGYADSGMGGGPTAEQENDA